MGLVAHLPLLLAVNMRNAQAEIVCPLRNATIEMVAHFLAAYGLRGVAHTTNLHCTELDVPCQSVLCVAGGNACGK